MFQALIPLIKAGIEARIRGAVRSAVGGIVAAAALTVAVAFFCAAGFIALLPVVGPIGTCLVFGGAFLAAALFALIFVAATKRRAARATLTLAQVTRDPQALAIGADIVRLLGGRRAASAGLVGAFIAGILLSRNVPKK